MNIYIYKLLLLGILFINTNSFSMNMGIFKETFSNKWKAPCSFIYNSNNVLTNIATPKNISYINNYSTVFLFPGCCGHSPRLLETNDNKIIPFEINFLEDNIRSEISIFYKSGILYNVQITPFRDNTNFYKHFIPSLKSTEEVVNIMMNNQWNGIRKYQLPDTKENNNEIILNGFNLFPYFSGDKNLVKSCYEDGIVMVVPKIIPIGKNFKFVFGSMIDKKIYKQLFINYDIYGNLKKWTYDEFKLQKK